MTEPRRIRAPIVRIVDRGDSSTVIGPRGALRFDADSAQLLRAVLEICARPTTRAELLAALAERSAGDVPAQPVDDLLALLIRDGILVDAPSRPRRARVLSRRVVLAISGAVAAVDAPILIRGLHELGCDVRVAMTRTAHRFAAIAALEALVHHQVWRSLWQRTEEAPVPHVQLAEWAELVVVWPASATTIARIAAGDCSDLVSAIATATRAPVVIAPSMNDAMLGAPAVQDNLETLRAHGRYVVHGAMGIEVAHRPEHRAPMFGPAAPPAAMLDIVRHLLVDVFPARPLPDTAAGWETLWATTPAERLPWTLEPIDAPLATALDRLRGAGDRRLLELGTGTGTVAIEAARRGFRVTATDVSPTALGRARAAAGDLPILFALDDAVACHVDGAFDVVVDRGLLHCLPPATREVYAATVTARTTAGGTLLVTAHQSSGLATHPIPEATLRALFPRFELVGATPTTLSNGDALLFELRSIL